MLELGIGIGIAVGMIVSLLAIIAMGVWRIASNKKNIFEEVHGIRTKLEEVQ